MMYLKVDNGFSMQTIFKSNDLGEMEKMKAKAQALWPDIEIVVETTN